MQGCCIWHGDICLPCRVYQLSTIPKGVNHVFPTAFRSQQSSDFSDEELPGKGLGEMLLPAHMPLCSWLTSFSLFNKVPCREANTEAPETGAEQLILKTSFPAIFDPVQKEVRDSLLVQLLKMKHGACRKHQDELDPEIYRAPDMLLAIPDPSQIPWKRIKPLGSRWKVMNLLSLLCRNQSWFYGLPSD